MKKLVTLCLLLALSFSALQSSFASGSCTPNYLGYTSVQCTFNGDANALEYYYKSNSSSIYLHFWGEVKAGGVYIYNYITTPSSFNDLVLYLGDPADDFWVYGYDYPGTILLYTESVGSDNVGGVAAMWW